MNVIGRLGKDERDPYSPSKKSQFRCRHLPEEGRGVLCFCEHSFLVTNHFILKDFTHSEDVTEEWRYVCQKADENNVTLYALDIAPYPFMEKKCCAWSVDTFA